LQNETAHQIAQVYVRGAGVRVPCRCGRPQSSLCPQGPAAGKIAPLSWLMIILFLVITFIMWVLIVWGNLPPSRYVEDHAPIDGGGGQGWIGIGGFGVPFVVLFILIYRKYKKLFLP
jgi:hypothetical protein